MYTIWVHINKYIQVSKHIYGITKVHTPHRAQAFGFVAALCILLLHFAASHLGMLLSRTIYASARLQAFSFRSRIHQN